MQVDLLENLPNFDYVTIMSTGNALDFGDLPFTHSISNDSGFSSETRGLFHQGLSTGPTTFHNIIDYITIASTGNAQDFGDTTTKRLIALDWVHQLVVYGLVDMAQPLLV